MKYLLILVTLLVCSNLAAQITVGPQPPARKAGQSYSHTFVATGGSGGPYTYWIDFPSVAPTGLTLNSTTGVLSGIPITDGSGSGQNYYFDVTAFDNTNNSGATSMTMPPAGSSGSDADSGGCAAGASQGYGLLLVGLLGLFATGFYSRRRS